MDQKCSRFRYWLVKGSLSDKAACWSSPLRRTVSTIICKWSDIRHHQCIGFCSNNMCVNNFYIGDRAVNTEAWEIRHLTLKTITLPSCAADNLFQPDCLRTVILFFSLFFIWTLRAAEWILHSRCFAFLDLTLSVALGMTQKTLWNAFWVVF